MRTAFLLALIYLALLAQTTLAPQLAIAGVSPRFVPLAFYVILACSTPRAGLILVCACGLAADCVSPGPLGIEAVAGILLAALLHRWQVRGTLHQFAVASWLLPLALTIETGLVTATRLWWSDREVDVRALLGFSGASACYTALVGGMLLPRLPSGVYSPAALPPRSPAAV